MAKDAKTTITKKRKGRKTVTKITVVPNPSDAVARLDLPFERGDHVEVARRMIQVLQSQGPVVVAGQRLYQYDHASGIWQCIERRVLRGLIHRFSGAQVIAANGTKPLTLTHNAIEGIAHVVHDAPELQRPGFFEGAPLGLAFENGFAAVTKTNEENPIKLKPHAEENRARWAASCAWDAKAAGGSWRTFLRSTFPGEEQSAIRSLIQEYVGVSLFGITPRLQSALVWIGEGANGKGVLTETIEKLFPPSSVVSVLPSNWQDDNHAIAFTDALINLVDEMPKEAAVQSARFKAIIAGDLLTCNRKYLDQLTFRPRSGHVFSCNELPEWSDPTHGMWRRLIPIEFNRTFSPKDTDWVPRADLIAALEADLPGIYACVLRAGARVALSSRLTVPAAAKALKKAWRGDLDSVARWIQEGLGPDFAEWTKASDLHDKYGKWCRRKQLKPVSLVAFGRRLSAIGWNKRRRGDGTLWAPK